MKAKPLWRVAIVTSSQAEDAVTELWTELFTQPAASYTDLEDRSTTVSAFLEQKPDWSPARLREIRRRLQHLQACGLEIGPATLRLNRVRREDWAESWKRHFKPLVIGRALLIRPSWVRRRPRPGQAEVVLDPGLSFGTGQHPTTAFCLKQVARYRPQGAAKSLLDLGTGSGILALAAAKLGFKPIVAMEFDPDSLEIARQNARQNKLEKLIDFQLQDVTKLTVRSGDHYDLVCANLISSLLLSERRRILARLAPAGCLVLAGILQEEFSQVQAAYEDAGLRLISSQVQNEWCSGAFTWA